MATNRVVLSIGLGLGAAAVARAQNSAITDSHAWLRQCHLLVPLEP